MDTKQWIILVLLALSIGVAYRIYTRPPSGDRTIPTDPNEFMPMMADRAVAFARQGGKVLDYSPGSIKSVEAVLEELHQARSKQQLSDADVNVNAIRYGAYIGEVLRRKYGGTWAIDHPVAGPKTYPIHWKGGESFPVGWCGKRILNGEEDNVWFKFQVVTSDAYRGGTQPGNPESMNSSGLPPPRQKN
jgi:hypothetical protein